MIDLTSKQCDANFRHARALAEQQLKDGHILNLSIDSDHEVGRRIFVETNQGWDPDPFYVDYPSEHDVQSAACH